MYINKPNSILKQYKFEKETRQEENKVKSLPVHVSEFKACAVKQETSVIEMEYVAGCPRGQIKASQ